MSGRELVAYLVLMLCFGYLGWAYHQRSVELEELRAVPPETVTVYVDHGAVDLTELGGVYCHLPPPGPPGLTATDP